MTSGLCIKPQPARPAVSDSQIVSHHQIHQSTGCWFNFVVLPFGRSSLQRLPKSSAPPAPCRVAGTRSGKYPGEFCGKAWGERLNGPTQKPERRGMDQNQSWHNSLSSANSQSYWCVVRFCDFCIAIPKPKVLLTCWQIRQINKHGFSATNPPNLSGLKIENHLGFGESQKFWEHPHDPHLCCFNPHFSYSSAGKPAAFLVGSWSSARPQT